MKRALGGLVAAFLLIVVGAACAPPTPTPGVFGDVWWETIVRAVKAVWGTAPTNNHVNCATIIFDQSIRESDFRGQFTPVYMPNDIYAWLMACFPAGQGAHIAPTFKASNRPNSPNPNKQAVCWVHNFVPDGDMIFDCYFDRVLPQQAWIPRIETSWDGYMAVGTT